MLSSERFIAKENEMGVSLDNDAYVDIFRMALKHIPTSGSLIDLGCGVGGMLKAAKESGFSVVGYDLFHKGGDIINDDFLNRTITSNVVSIIEVAEHIETKRFEHWIKTSLHCEYLLFSSTSTHNDKGIPDEDWGHINIQSQQYWVDLMKDAGYTLVKELEHPTEWTKLFKST